MDFFTQQDHARKQTRSLVLLMLAAVVVIVALVNLIAAFSWTWLQTGVSDPSYPRGFFLTNTLVTAGLILGGTLVELFNLREGGDAVARMAGGWYLPPRMTRRSAACKTSRRKWRSHQGSPARRFTCSTGKRRSMPSLPATTRMKRSSP